MTKDAIESENGGPWITISFRAPPVVRQLAEQGVRRNPGLYPNLSRWLLCAVAARVLRERFGLDDIFIDLDGRITVEFPEDMDPTFDPNDDEDRDD